jgi:cytochrome c oxidase subunit 4
MADHGHGSHGAHGADHVPHVAPLRVYLATWGALVVLTAITVGASYVDFGPGNLAIALLIATVKATVVAALFMHLWHDHKFHTLILVSGGLFLMIFVAFTMFDTEYRGRADALESDRPVDITRPFESTQSLAAVRARWAKTDGHGGAAPSASAPALTPPQGIVPATTATPSEAPAGSAVAPAGSAAPTEASAAPAGSVAPAGSAEPATSVAPAESAPAPTHVH